MTDLSAIAGILREANVGPQQRADIIQAIRSAAQEHGVTITANPGGARSRMLAVAAARRMGINVPNEGLTASEFDQAARGSSISIEDRILTKALLFNSGLMPAESSVV